MVCPKCGKKVEEDDIFCQNCGYKIKKKEIDETKLKDKRIRKKSIGIILFCLIIVITIIIGLIYLEMQPKNIEMEADELAELIDNGESAQYYGDNIKVHGFLYRSNSDDEYSRKIYSLYSQDNPNYQLTFSVDEPIADDVGNGSEIIITGRLGELSSSGIEILIVNDIDIQKKIENITLLEISELYDNIDDYLNKKVKVIGQIVITNTNGAYISDEKLVKSIWIYGKSNAELYDIQKNGPWCITEGTIKVVDGNYVIDVENIYTDDSLNYLNIQYDNVQVSTILTKADMYIGKEVTVIGNLSMDLSEISPGVYEYVLYDTSDQESYLLLNGAIPDIGGCTAIVSGKIINLNGYITLDAKSYERLY